ncbi:hypothetical protein OAB00_00025 [Akkermansiaceae bacterium]|nr:hypothetical protein [Akkermansiaceae bacterium]
MITTSTLEILDQGIAVLDKLSDRDYDTPFELVYGGTIGGHYRHVLEHFTTLINSFESGVVNYDLRVRNKEIETQRVTAIDATLSLRKKFQELPKEVYSTPMQLQGKISSTQPDIADIPTTAGREVAYAIAHAHHHFAIIGIMCKLVDSPTDSQFGVAPSTLEHKKSQAV